MLSNRSLPLLIVLALGLLALVLYYYYRPAAPRYDWRESWSPNAYNEQSEEPYGIYIFHNLLKNYFPQKKLETLKNEISLSLPLDSTGNSVYILIGEAIYLDSASLHRLFAFAKLGNTVFLSTKSMDAGIMDSLSHYQCTQEYWSDYAVFSDSAVDLSMANGPKDTAAWSFSYVRQNQTQSFRWQYLKEQFVCADEGHRTLGFVNDYLINYARMPYGKGRFLLHTTPIAFTNYHLLRKEGRAYAEKVLEWLPEGNIYWDRISKVPEAVSRRRNDVAYRNLADEHPLTYLLKHRGLAWAWYLLFGLVLLYLVFNARRRQRIIPVLPKNENSSYAFISTIANLHFKEKNYRGLCRQMMRVFLNQIRERYGLSAPIEPDTELPKTDDGFFSRLAQVSEVPEKEIRTIFTQYTNTVQFEPNEDMMVELHLSIEKFSKLAK